MQAIVATIASWAGAIRDYLACFFQEAFMCRFFNLFFDLLGGAVTVLAGALAWVPVPAAVSGFVWPDPGPIGSVLIELDIPQAMSILAACMTTKFILRLIPLVRL